MPAFTAPVRLPSYDHDLTPTELGHLRYSFPTYDGDLAEACAASITRLTYRERRSYHYERVWIIAMGPPTRKTSFDFQRWMAYSVGIPFTQVARCLERVELALLAAETAGRVVRTAYEPRKVRSLAVFCGDAEIVVK
jgi:hypothetical protein